MTTPVAAEEIQRVVTGGSRGIGVAIAKRLAQDGAAVATTCASAQPKR